MTVNTYSDDANEYSRPPQDDQQVQSNSLRPTGVTVTSVLCILAGIVGILIAIMTAAQLAFGQQLATSFAPAGEAGNLQREMAAEMMAINGKYLVGHVINFVAGLALGASLLIGGIGLLAPKHWALGWLRKTFLAAIAFEIFRIVFYVMLQTDMLPVFEQQWEASFPAAMREMQRAMIIVSAVLWGAWFLIKIGVYVWGRQYLNRENVRNYVDAATQKN